MKINACMKPNVVSIPSSATIGDAAALFIEDHIGMLPVVDDTGRLLGILRLGDLLALVMPDFVKLIEDFDFVHDFGVVETKEPSPEVLALTIGQVMQPLVSVPETCGLLRAFAVMRHHDVYDLPVVSPEGKLVGIASRVDIGAALLSQWHLSANGESQ